MSSESDTIKSLRQRIWDLENEVKSKDNKRARDKISVMSSEVIDSNPYSRLMALKRMGIVDNYESIRDFTVIIVGVGGVGSVAAEMLTRCGIGKLILFDYDKVEIANMNRLFFKPDQAGMTKTAASKQTLNEINPDVEIEDFTYDITTPDNFDHFCSKITGGGKDSGRVSLVLSCVDNYSARTAINQACNELDQVWFESGVSEDAVSGHIQTLLPGRTACFECLPPLIVASGIDEKTLKRDGVCAASLPTTMGLVAALLVQNTLKFLLGFGQISYYLGYSALLDHFPSGVMRPNPDCGNSFCRRLQHKYEGQWAPMQWSGRKIDPEVELHTENDWGIEVVSTTVTEEQITSLPPPPSSSVHSLPEGLGFKYDVMEAEDDSDAATAAMVSGEGMESLDDLMNQLKGLQ